jgi:hypothetical protein
MTERRHRQTSQVLHQQQQKLVERIVARQYALCSRGRWQPLGDADREKSVRHASYQPSYLAEVVAAHDPPLFEDCVA